MKPKEKDRIIEAICKGTSLYVKGTGIEVSVVYFGTDSHTFNSEKSKVTKCSIEFIGIPTASTLKLFVSYHIKKNSHSNLMELEGTIDIANLSLTPFETKAGKLLYDKKGK